MKLIKRTELRKRIVTALRRNRAVGLIGPRQCGKTTLARQIAAERKTEYFDLEDPTDNARLRDPILILEKLSGLIVIDEIQRRPDIMPVLRVLIDRTPNTTRYLLLGSASPELIQHTSETLAGRIEYVEMQGFVLDEVGRQHIDDLWLRGGFPLSFLGADDETSLQWRLSFIRTFIERDLHMLGFDLPSTAVRRFLTMLAHYHGQTCNTSELGRSLQLSHTTIRRYIDLMSSAFIVRQLPPWFENMGKRLVKSPKIYIRDSGLLHALLGIDTRADLLGHPKLGASWEGFALETILSRTDDRFASFWGTHSGAELDLCLIRGSRRIGYEFKYTSAPVITRSMRSSLSDLNLQHLYIVYPGSKEFPVSERITAVPLSVLSLRNGHNGKKEKA